MNWTDIIICLITALLTGGGLTAIRTSGEKKIAAKISNLADITKEYLKVADLKDKVIEDLRKEKEALSEKVDELYQLEADKRELIDQLNTRVAVLTILRCNTTRCADRKPPFGSKINDTFLTSEIKTEDNAVNKKL